MTAAVPVVYLLSVGADPTDAIETLCRKKKQTIQIVSMGQGQEAPALKAINAASVNGSWVLLQNCELGLDLMEQLEELMHKMRPTLSEGFRFFLSAAPHPKFPLGLLQMCTKVTNEPPAGLRAGVLRSYSVNVDQERLERVETSQWRQLLFGLCFLHSIVQERRKFGPLGFCIPYEFNTSDLTACIMYLEKHLYSGPMSWETFQYMVAEAQYGGKITDDMDGRLFQTYAKAWICSDALKDAFTYNPGAPIQPIPDGFSYTMPDNMELAQYRTYISSFPEVDSPEIFGLHPNADITYRVKEVNGLLNTLSDTQPKSGGAGGGQSREDVVYEKAGDLLLKLPEDYMPDDYKAKIRSLGGLEVPLNIFLFQEIQQLQKVITKVKTALTALQQAVRGEVVMTRELYNTVNSMFEARVPHTWALTPGGDEFSWISPTLGLWFASLIQRDVQQRTWLNTGRPHGYWLGGFKNPAGFLTAMKQEVTRQHKNDDWALDDVIYRTEVTTHDGVDHLRAAPKEGVFIYGIIVDGASWSKVGEYTQSGVPLPENVEFIALTATLHF